MNTQSPKQAALELIRASNNIALLTHKNPDGDALGSILALSLVLEKLAIKVKPVLLGISSTGLDFLPYFDKLKSKFLEQEVVLSFDLKDNEITFFLSKDDKAKKFHIKLSVEGTPLDVNTLKIQNNQDIYDLVITLDVADKEQIEDVLNQNLEILQNIPLLNIDHHVTNTNFGTVNVVDATASSTTEILVSLIEALGGKTSLFDSDIATCLLTGVITDTGLFQNQNTTPKSLTVAAQLVALGGRRAEIVDKLFRSKTLKQVKLIGRAVDHIKNEDIFIWSQLSLADQSELGVTEADITGTGIIDDQLKVIEGPQFVLLLIEKEDGIKGSLRTANEIYDVSKIAELFKGGGHKGAAGFFIPNITLAEKGQAIIDKIKKSI